METYFEGQFDSNGDGGMMCEGETPDARVATVFPVMDRIRKKSFADIGSEYLPREEEQTCAIRLASNVFFEVKMVQLCQPW